MTNKKYRKFTDFEAEDSVKNKKLKKQKTKKKALKPSSSYKMKYKHHLRNELFEEE